MRRFDGHTDQRETGRRLEFLAGEKIGYRLRIIQPGETAAKPSPPFHFQFANFARTW